jgi:predicted aldo/keto reductase-like oxidoreductase
METREYKFTDELVSLLGFGCMRLPLLPNSSSDKDIDVERVSEMVDYAMSHNVNYYDTAWMYHDHQSEPIMGEILSKYERNTFNLATKMPLAFIENEYDIERIFNEQLNNLKTDYFDYYLLHNINSSQLNKIQAFKIYEKMKAKQAEGKIRYLGFSFHDNASLIKDVIKMAEWDFAQIQFNYMDWELLNSHQLYHSLKEKGIPIIVMEPVRGGTLSTLCEKSIEIFKNANPNVSVASWALRFVASFPEVLTVLSGMSNMEQLEDNVKTMENFLPLDRDEFHTIVEALGEYRKSASIPCTACRYCMNCPEGVEIPKILAMYNNYLTGKANNRRLNDMVFRMEYATLDKEQHTSNCIRCNICAERCPQHIEIPDLMEKITKMLSET